MVKAVAEPGSWRGGALESLKSPMENFHGYSMGMLTPLLMVQELGLKFKIVMPSDIICPSYCNCCLWTGCSTQEAEKPLMFREKVCPAALLVCIAELLHLLHSCRFSANLCKEEA